MALFVHVNFDCIMVATSGRIVLPVCSTNRSSLYIHGVTNSSPVSTAYHQYRECHIQKSMYLRR